MTPPELDPNEPQYTFEDLAAQFYLLPISSQQALLPVMRGLMEGEINRIVLEEEGKDLYQSSKVVFQSEIKWGEITQFSDLTEITPTTFNRLFYALKRGGIKTPLELFNSFDTILAVKGVGSKSLPILQAFLDLCIEHEIFQKES